jgi:hypothetical protein
MRTSSLLPLTALVAGVAGCGSEARVQAGRSVPQRDLTLVTQTAEVKIASPMEAQRLRVRQATARRSPSAARPVSATRSRRAPKPSVAAVASPPATLAAGAAPVPADEPAAQPPGTALTSDNDRELLPGRTVTMIPASTGPSPGSGTADEAPPERGGIMVVRGGGTCRGRGRGPGIGIATAPRPDFR